MRSSPLCLLCLLWLLLSLALGQVRSGIDRVVVRPHFIVKMRSCGPARVANKADHVAAFHDLPGFDKESGEMAISRRQPIAMADDDQVTVRSLALGKDDIPVGRCENLGPI